jgi:hypothetical protein
VGIDHHRKHDNLPRPRRTLLIVASETETIPALVSGIIRLMRDEALQMRRSLPPFVSEADGHREAD